MSAEKNAGRGNALITRREIVITLVLGVIVNILTSLGGILLGLLAPNYLLLGLPPRYIPVIAFICAVPISIWIVLRNYRRVLRRASYVTYLRQDSATSSFDLFVGIAKRLIEESKSRPEDERIERFVIPEINELITMRRQPMQIARIDFEDIRARFADRMGGRPRGVSEEDQLSYYLDFVDAYKKMAIPRIVKQFALYAQTFGVDEFTDYVITYGHSSIVVKSIIAAHYIRRFTVIVIEDLQYQEHSLGEHEIVRRKLSDADIPSYLVRFDQIRDLFEVNVTHIKDMHGQRLSLPPKRRFHAVFGSERIDRHGSALVPSLLEGKPSDTAQIIERLELFARSEQYRSVTRARVIVLAESYKVRDFTEEDKHTHVPLQGKRLQSVLYILGLTKRLPKLFPVVLFDIKPPRIYAHINELGIFPNIGGEFDLQYCIDLFRTETSLLGLFSEPSVLDYRYFDEIKAVLFDLNGVVADDEEAHYLAFAQVVRDIGLTLSRTDYRKLCQGRSDKDGVENIKKQHQLSTDTDLLVTQKHNSYLQSLLDSKIQTFPGVRTLLKELKSKGYKTALVTASNKQEVDALLNHLGVSGSFDVIVTDDDVKESKPSCEGYIAAADKLGVEFSRCLIVEDSERNIDVAAKFDVRTVGVRNDEDKTFKSASYRVNTLEEMLTL